MEARDFVVDLRTWGLTQAQIAERSGIPQPTISKIVRGEVKDVLSQNYRSLQAVHAAESANQRAASLAKASPRAEPHGQRPSGVGVLGGPQRFHEHANLDRPARDRGGR